LISTSCSYQWVTLDGKADAARRTDPAPAWFTQALAVPGEPIETKVQGALIRARRWGTSGPGLVLVHGAGAHARWWDPLAPLLAEDHQVVALDLSGHGDSDHRDQYDLTTWGAEIAAVAQQSGLAEPWVAVAHSHGGWASLDCAIHHPERVAGVVVIDSTIRPPHIPNSPTASHRVSAPAVYRDTPEELLGRFRLVPADPWLPQYAAEYVARHSIRQEQDGWRWKFDPKVFARPDWGGAELLRGAPCAVAVFRAEHGLIDPEIAQETVDLLGGRGPVITVPAAGHAVILDQPLAVAVGVRTVLATWRGGT
jgi:pimeloyl-ACP methyl ester carboxylesterase